MIKIEKRKHPRVDIIDPISFWELDSKGNQLDQHMGFARNVGQEGIGIEADCAIRSDYVKLMILDLSNSAIKIKGKVVYCRKSEAGKFECGIRLVGIREQKLRFVKKLVQSYHYQKEKSGMFISAEKGVNA